jgi:hypothetical protein
MKKHTKRFMVIFSMWGKSLSARDMRGLFNLKEYAHSETEFDTESEWKEEVGLIEDVYANTPKPYKVEIEDSKYHEKTWEFEVNSRFWGYLVLDFDKERVIKVGGDGIYKYHKNDIGSWRSEQVSLRMLDEFFRGEDEIPKDYVFDTGEYEGWLQYRWGDGKNAITRGSKKVRTKKAVKGKHAPLTDAEREYILSD